MFDHRIELLDAHGKAAESVNAATRAQLISAGNAIPIGGNWRAIHRAFTVFEQVGHQEKAQLFLSGVMMGLLSTARTLRSAKPID